MCLNQTLFKIEREKPVRATPKLAVFQKKQSLLYKEGVWGGGERVTREQPLAEGKKFKNVGSITFQSVCQWDLKTVLTIFVLISIFIVQKEKPHAKFTYTSAQTSMEDPHLISNSGVSSQNLSLNSQLRTENNSSIKKSRVILPPKNKFQSIYLQIRYAPV